LAAVARTLRFHPLAPLLEMGDPAANSNPVSRVKKIFVIRFHHRNFKASDVIPQDGPLRRWGLSSGSDGQNPVEPTPEVIYDFARIRSSYR
jgi:hypothetical protein